MRLCNKARQAELFRGDITTGQGRRLYLRSVQLSHRPSYGQRGKQCTSMPHRRAAGVPRNIQDEVDTPFWAPHWGDLKAVDIHDSDGSRAA